MFDECSPKSFGSASTEKAQVDTVLIAERRVPPPRCGGFVKGAHYLRAPCLRPLSEARFGVIAKRASALSSLPEGAWI